MKPFIKTLLISLATITIGINVQAAVKHHTSTEDMFDQDESPFSQQANTITSWHNFYDNLPINQWDGSFAYKAAKMFCLKNPVFQWLEYQQNITFDEKSQEGQCIKKFFDAIRSEIWKNQQHRINGFIELIIFLQTRINRYIEIRSLQEAAHEAASDSPKLKKAKLDEFANQGDEEADQGVLEKLIDKVYGDYAQKHTLAFESALHKEWTFLHSDYSDNNWMLSVKKVFILPLSSIQISDIEMFAQQAKLFLSFIFKDDPTFK